MHFPRISPLLWPVLILGQLGCSAAALAERVDPNDLLNRMGAAVQATSYEGTVIRIQDGKAEALKVIHTVTDGVIREKVVAQEGNGLEIIRNGNEVHCILPDQQVGPGRGVGRSVDIILNVAIEPGAIRQRIRCVDCARRTRSRPAERVLVAIRPHDNYRYGHRIWLDTETAFPLQTQLIGEDGTVIEQVKFADISLNKDIHASALAPSISTENFRWLNQPSRHVKREIETSWQSTDLPPGFRAVATHGETLPGSEEVVTHILYSDGLANVSVFVAQQDQASAAGPSRVGGSNSYSASIEGHRITAVGEVPAVTVEQIAATMSLH